MTDWYVSNGDGDPVGPVPTEHVVQWIQTGGVPVTALVCPVGGTAWSPVSAVPEFAAAVRHVAPPPPPASDVGAGEPLDSSARKASKRAAEHRPPPEQDAEPTTLFPNFCRRPIPCPGCGKKALRPRMRTRDFRCQACSVIYRGQEIEDAVSRLDQRDEREARRRDAEYAIAHVIFSILVRGIPAQYRSGDSFWEDWLKEKKEKEGLPGTVSLLFGFGLTIAATIAAGILIFDSFGDWSIGGRMGLTVAAFAVAAIVLSGGTSLLSIALNEAAAEQKHRDDRAEWELRNPVLMKLHADFDFFKTLRKNAVDGSDLVSRAKFRYAVETCLEAEEKDAGPASWSVWKLASRVWIAMDQLRTSWKWASRKNAVDGAVTQYGTAEEQATYAEAIAVFEAEESETRTAVAS